MNISTSPKRYFPQYFTYNPVTVCGGHPENLIVHTQSLQYCCIVAGLYKLRSVQVSIDGNGGQYCSWPGWGTTIERHYSTLEREMKYVNIYMY